MQHMIHSLCEWSRINICFLNSLYIVRWSISNYIKRCFGCSDWFFFFSNFMRMGILLAKKESKMNNRNILNCYNLFILVAFEGTQNLTVISAARFDFFGSNVKQMGILLEKKKARRATEAPSLRIFQVFAAHFAFFYFSRIPVELTIE